MPEIEARLVDFDDYPLEICAKMSVLEWRIIKEDIGRRELGNPTRAFLDAITAALSHLEERVESSYSSK